jgi:hypothetical protein
MRKWLAIAAVGLVALTGCTGDGDTATATPSGQSASDGAGQESSSASPSGSSSPAPAPESAFGEAYKYRDGLAVTVAEPKSFKPSKDAIRGGEPDFVSFEITVVNGGSQEVGLTDFTVTVQSGGGEGGDVRDPKSRISGVPTKPIAPGKKATWTMAFGVVDAQDVRVQVLPGLEAEPATFGR